MKLPAWLAPIIVGVIFSLQGWTLIEIVNLKVSVARIAGRLNIESKKHENQNEKYPAALAVLRGFNGVP